ncbi:uncharacterized protein LOC119689611 [Teleopsis dalmanni]|uniref:uncharacterized protein LOC119689611 n=1 Tax=Teleopsis dalmanni TaxID=139649 RepID=UPI0018CD07C2|nr:uncharacterized protein LOC119689611 [Teleopsis dalmanni]
MDVNKDNLILKAEPIKRKRGRPRNIKLVPSEEEKIRSSKSEDGPVGEMQKNYTTNSKNSAPSLVNASVQLVTDHIKRKRGRPRKIKIVPSEGVKSKLIERDRPRNIKLASSEEEKIRSSENEDGINSEMQENVTTNSKNSAPSLVNASVQATDTSIEETFFQPFKQYVAEFNDRQKKIFACEVHKAFLAVFDDDRDFGGVRTTAANTANMKVFKENIPFLSFP